MNYQDILALLRSQVVPAVGCTEPAAVALATAKCAETLGQKPEAIELALSANIIKNAMGVGIPGTGQTGLPIAVALGATIGHSGYGLEVLRDLTPEGLEAARAIVASGIISIAQADTPHLLYICVVCRSGEHTAKVIIQDSHTNIVLVEKDGEEVGSEELGVRSDMPADSDSKTIHSSLLTNNSKLKTPNSPLCLQDVWRFATTAPLSDISFLLEARDLNMRAARQAILGNYGHNLGKTIDRPLSQGIFGKTIFAKMIARTASACDARMGGAPIPVMSNSGSGNQGICATNPVAVFAEENENTEEELIRALTLSHLTAIYIHSTLGPLSALCGCVVASIGSSCAVTYLMGGDYTQICRAVKNMIANLTGMICDGAKPSCSLKIASGVSTSVMSALLAIEGKCVDSTEGIIDDDVDRSIRNLTGIGREAMRDTDKMVIDIMTNK